MSEDLKREFWKFKERIEKLEKADKECSNTHIKYQAKFSKELSEMKKDLESLTLDTTLENEVSELRLKIEMQGSYNANFFNDLKELKEQLGIVDLRIDIKVDPLEKQIDYLNRKTQANAECNMELDRNRIHDHFNLKEVLRELIERLIHEDDMHQLLDKLGGDTSVSIPDNEQRGGLNPYHHSESQPPNFINEHKKGLDEYFEKDYKNPSEQDDKCDSFGHIFMNNICKYCGIDVNKWKYQSIKEKEPPEALAGSARQTECICPDCKSIQCWKWEGLVIVEKADLEWLINHVEVESFEFINEAERYRVLREKYLPEKEEE